ncbi:MAG: hypothetical protein Q8L76_13950 [Cypionkella sp.]|uniref:DUF7940 domain-containing protein n=1 Tax=Cypionkella sp. TaxID=2811411 RepID=UPI002730C98A|nr:hypothetical protein [Cypionkella sp.]MDP1577836.1 hypothetical protein [Cypionkella sp.]MDP2051934.1 hypothetical protein [Cypionkella sp.]
MSPGFLVSNWRKVLAQSWSIRLMALAGIFSGIEAALPYLEQSFDWPRGSFAALSGITVGAAFIARLVAQKKLQEEDHGDEE